MTAIPYQVSAMLRTYGRQVTTARRLARYRRSLRAAGAEDLVPAAAGLADELGFPLVFAYPPQDQEMQIFKNEPGRDPELIEGEEKVAAMRRLWELALEKVDATML